MKYKGTLIVVKDCHKALQFYRDLFGFELLRDNDGNMELSGNLYLQESKYWEKFTERSVLPKNNSTELYFEEADLEGFFQKLRTLYPDTELVNPPMTHSWGQKVVRFYDPDGNLIEVGTPMISDYAIDTNRLKIYAASQEQMTAFIETQSAEDLKAAYTEMLHGCLSHPKQWEWYAIWMIELKSGAHIGELCFKGISEEGMTEIGYGIAEEYRNCGYAAEAVSAVVDWALTQPCIAGVTAETEKSNIASQRVLSKAGFMPTGEMGEESPLYVRKK